MFYWMEALSVASALAVAFASAALNDLKIQLSIYRNQHKKTYIEQI